MKRRGPGGAKKTDLTSLKEGEKDEERAHDNSRNPWWRPCRRAITLPLYIGAANQVLICLKAAIWEAAQIHTELSIEIRGVSSPRPARRFLNPSGGLGSIFSRRAQKVSIALLFPSLQAAPNIGSLSLFLFYLLTCFFYVRAIPSVQSFP